MSNTADKKLWEDRDKLNCEIWQYEKYSNDEWKLYKKHKIDGNFFVIDEKPVMINKIEYFTISYSFLNTDMNHKTCGACYQVKYL